MLVLQSVAVEHINVTVLMMLVVITRYKFMMFLAFYGIRTNIIMKVPGIFMFLPRMIDVKIASGIISKKDMRLNVRL